MTDAVETGKDAKAGPIIDRILKEYDELSIPKEAARNKELSWDNPRHRRMIRERFDDGGAEEALLPGFGELGRARNAREDCGDPHPFVCDSCGQNVNMGRTCGMSICGRCAQVWARDLGIRKSAKLCRLRIEKNQSTPDNLLQKGHHLILSAPPGWYYDLASEYGRELALEVTREVVKDILEELRAQGLLIRHSYRGENPDGSLRSESDDRGRWKERLFSGRDWYGDVRDDLAWKPHYHAVVISDYINVRGEEDEISLTERVEEATGWVIHRIEDNRGISLETDGDIARASTYSISHADIMVRPDANNRSAIWEVGAFQGDAIKSSGRFSPRPWDLEWADGAVRRIASKILGIKSGSSDCGALIPPVDDPNELAIRILEELYSDDEDVRDEIPNEAVLYHVSEGNILVKTSSSGGGSVSVSSAFGLPAKRGSIELPAGSSTWSIPEPIEPSRVDPSELLSTSSDDGPSSCDHDHGDDVVGSTCKGSLIPLDEARRQGLLEDDDWISSASHSDEALEADREWPDDLEPWRSSSPGKANPAIG